MKLLSLLSISCVLFICSSCSMFSSGKGMDVPSPKEFKRGGVTLNINADPQLNRYKNTSHTLLVCIYQLKDPNAFNQLADDPNSISKLMECGKFDSSIAYSKRLVVQPGQSVIEKLDTAEGSRFMGIVAGYYKTGSEKVTHLAPLSSKSSTSVGLELGPNEISAVMVK